MSYIDYEDYVSSPLSADPAELLGEERLRTYWLRQRLAERDAELADRERQVNASFLTSGD